MPACSCQRFALVPALPLRCRSRAVSFTQRACPTPARAAMASYPFSPSLEELPVRRGEEGSREGTLALRPKMARLAEAFPGTLVRQEAFHRCMHGFDARRPCGGPPPAAAATAAARAGASPLALLPPAFLTQPHAVFHLLANVQTEVLARILGLLDPRQLSLAEAACRRLRSVGEPLSRQACPIQALGAGQSPRHDSGAA